MSAAGDGICRATLSYARRAAADLRCDRDTSGFARFALGMMLGKIQIADIWLNADPDLVMSVENEVTFLLRQYLRGRS